MKKTAFLLVALMAISLSLAAQNTFKGIVKYKVESSGEVAFQLPAEAATAEVRVSGNDMSTSGAVFMSNPFAEQIVVNNMTVTYCLNYGQLLAYLRNNGSEFTYQGDGKLLSKHTFKESEADSLTIVDTEPGHYYFEYVDGEMREIAGVQAKKVILHSYDAEGNDQPTVMWYSDEIGPKYNFLFMGLKGMPLMCKQNIGEGKAVTYTAIEVVKGKVKEGDFLLPYGYEQLSDEDMQTLGTEIQEELELLQE